MLLGSFSAQVYIDSSHKGTEEFILIQYLSRFIYSNFDKKKII